MTSCIFHPLPEDKRKERRRKKKEVGEKNKIGTPSEIRKTNNPPNPCTASRLNPNLSFHRFWRRKGEEERKEKRRGEMGEKRERQITRQLESPHTTQWPLIHVRHTRTQREAREKVNFLDSLFRKGKGKGKGTRKETGSRKPIRAPRHGTTKFGTSTIATTAR